MLENLTLSTLPSIASSCIELGVFFGVGLVLYAIMKRRALGLSTMFYGLATCAGGLYISVVWTRLDNISADSALTDPHEFQTALGLLANCALAAVITAAVAVIIAGAAIWLGASREDKLQTSIGWLYLAHAGFIAGIALHVGNATRWDLDAFDVVPVALVFIGLLLSSVELGGYVRQRRAAAKQLSAAELLDVAK